LTAFPSVCIIILIKDDPVFGSARCDEGSFEKNCRRRRTIMRNAKLTTLPVAMPGIRSIVIDRARSQSPTFEGLSFGSVGQYEKLRGTAYGELDPSDPRNAVITDIELAPVNNRGMVEYSMDIFILKPINLSNGNHRLLFDFNNRGQMRVGHLNDAPVTNDPTTAADAGTGFTMNLGYTVVSNGWDFGASGFNSMKITVPVATNGGATITGPRTSTSYSTTALP
jgi:hypothetical protein